ncbi:MAG: phosphoglycerate kinase [Planctomycetota bacterium]|nr:phosphoglycerate kinase [Planctomycetota bacterium]
MAKKTIDQVDVAGRRVLMRVDFNVPLDDGGNITDDRRIRLALPTIKSVIERGGRLILMSHLGRPKGEGPEPAFSLRPAAERLGELLPDTHVRFVPDDCIGEAARHAVEELSDGQILLLENLRFHKKEKGNDADFARTLAAFGDIYCNDAFGTAHRNHASMHAVPRAMEGKPRVAGFLLQKELQYLADTIEHARRPFVAVLGGAKVSDKLGAIENLVGRVDAILIGGAMAYTFLKASGQSVGASLVEDDRLGDAEGMLKDGGGKIRLPADHHCGRKPEAGTPTRQFTGEIDDDWMGLDIGPDTIDRFRETIGEAKTIVWNGPMGVFETPPFEAGTRAVAEAIADATGRGAVSVIGGGDSAAAIEGFGLEEKVSHVSTGGGASLQMLEGRSFDSVDLLDEA